MVMTLRPFDGSEGIYGWLSHAEVVRRVNGWSKETLALVVQGSLVGEAAEWWERKVMPSQDQDEHTDDEGDESNLTWKEVRRLLTTQFARETPRTLLQQALTTPQGPRSVRAYASDLESAFARNPSFPDSGKMDVFISHLRPELRTWVNLLGAQDFEHAVELAKRAEKAAGAQDVQEHQMQYLQKTFETLNVQAPRSRESGRPTPRGERDYRPPVHTRVTAYREDRRGDDIRQDTFNGNCFHCGRTGHPANQCPKESRRISDGADRRQ